MLYRFTGQRPKALMAVTPTIRRYFSDALLVSLCRRGFTYVLCIEIFARSGLTPRYKPWQRKLTMLHLPVPRRRGRSGNAPSGIAARPGSTAFTATTTKSTRRSVTPASCVNATATNYDSYESMNLVPGTHFGREAQISTRKQYSGEELPCAHPPPDPVCSLNRVYLEAGSCILERKY